MNNTVVSNKIYIKWPKYITDNIENIQHSFENTIVSINLIKM